MSAKTRFLQRLHQTQPHSDPDTNTGQADLAAFRQHLTTLREKIDLWLTGTGISITDSSCMVTEMLISNSAFTLPCFTLHLKKRMIKFDPLFLYGQGVTGCVGVTLVANGEVVSLVRLFMRSAESCEWTYIMAQKPGGRRLAFNEEAFFEIIESLVP